MSHAFWLTGLPRSRTAWFAAALRGPHSSCHHELTAHVHSLDELLAKWKQGGRSYTGNSDSACGLHIRPILAQLKPKTLIVRRPLGEVEASLKAFLGYNALQLRANLETLDAALDITHPLVKTVAFKDLRDPLVLMGAVEWLVPGQSVAAMGLMNFNIQADREHSLSLARANRSGWHMSKVA